MTRWDKADVPNKGCKYIGIEQTFDFALYFYAVFWYNDKGKANRRY